MIAIERGWLWRIWLPAITIVRTRIGRFPSLTGCDGRAQVKKSGNDSPAALDYPLLNTYWEEMTFERPFSVYF